MHVLMETFTKSQFGYCPLAWMICVGKVNSRINHLHKQALRIVHKNKDLSFDELSKKKRKKKMALLRYTTGIINTAFQSKKWLNKQNNKQYFRETPNCVF